MRRLFLIACLVLAGCGGGREVSRIPEGYQVEEWAWYQLDSEASKNDEDIVLESWASDPAGVYSPAGGNHHWAATVKTFASTPPPGGDSWIAGEIMEKWVLDITLQWFGMAQPKGRFRINWAWEYQQTGITGPAGDGYSRMGIWRGVGGSLADYRVFPDDFFFPGTPVAEFWETPQSQVQQYRSLSQERERLLVAVGSISEVKARRLGEAICGLDTVECSPNRISVGVTLVPE